MNSRYTLSSLVFALAFASTGAAAATIDDTAPLAVTLLPEVRVIASMSHPLAEPAMRVAATAPQRMTLLPTLRVQARNDDGAVLLPAVRVVAAPDVATGESIAFQPDAREAARDEDVPLFHDRVLPR